MPDNTQAEAQGGAAGEAAVRQDSIEPGDDWIEQVLPYGRKKRKDYAFWRQ